MILLISDLMLPSALLFMLKMLKKNQRMIPLFAFAIAIWKLYESTLKIKFFIQLYLANISWVETGEHVDHFG
ncbi:MAG: hypothetical protein RIF36_12865 [Imperialibacter sp.]|uniref:hypothetical protein n=1 Tax=Imperialibacter sp. TaxID=2038411 RepID=UPI0032EFDC20